MILTTVLSNILNKDDKKYKLTSRFCVIYFIHFMALIKRFNYDIMLQSSAKIFETWQVASHQILILYLNTAISSYTYVKRKYSEQGYQI